jgi:Phage head-tail joining protein
MAKKLQLSQLRCLITIKGRTLTPDEIGGSTVTWAERGQTWACIEDMSKGESYRAMRSEALVGQRVIIRKGSIPPVEPIEGVEGVDEAAGYLAVEFSEDIDGNTPTGFPADDTELTATLAVDGTEYPIAFAGQDAQTFGEVLARVGEQAPVSGSIANNNSLVFTSQTTGSDSSVGYGTPHFFELLPSYTGLTNAAGTDETEAVEAVPASPGLTASDVVVYDGRTLPIKAINNLIEGNVEFQELICVQGDPTGPGI